MTVVLNIFMVFNYEIYSDLLKKQHFYNEIVDRCNRKSYNRFRKFDIEEKGDIMDKMLGGYQALQIRLLNGRIFQKLLSKEPDAQYRSEQGKILTILWKQELGCATATDIALATGLANNTLTTMVKKLETVSVKNWGRFSTEDFWIMKSENLRPIKSALSQI